MTTTIANATGADNIRFNLTPSETLTATAVDGQPPIRAMIHWLRLEGTLSRQDYRELILMVFEDDPFHVQHDIRFKRYPSDPGYSHKAVGELGQYVCWNVNEDGSYEVGLCLTGSWLEVTDIFKVLDLWDWADRAGMTTTRTDPAVEDHSKTLNLWNVAQAAIDGNFKWVKKKKVILSGEGSINDGLTIALGSRESDSYTRFYETWVKHNYLANKVESELKGYKAKRMAFLLLEVYRQNKELLTFGKPSDKLRLRNLIAQEIVSYAVGQVDFIDRSQKAKSGALENCERLEWWQEFLNLVGEGVKLSAKKVKKSLKKTYDWVQRQWLKTLSVLKQGLGDNFEQFIEIMADIGEERLDDEARMWIAVLQRDGLTAMV